MRKTILICAAFVLSLGACVPRDYGTSVQYAAHVTPKIPVTMPAAAPPISQQFRPQARDGGVGHMGLDVAAPTGTPVLAAAPGRVTISLYEPAYGHRVVIEHGTDAAGRRVQTLYFHLDRRDVDVGDRVARGDQIGTLGASGALSSFPHLHFEYHREEAPGARVAGGNNWWQGMVQEDPNLNWARGRGQVTCFTGASYPVDKITYPVLCNGAAGGR